MLDFKNLLSRADDEVLNNLLGRQFIETIKVLDSSRFSPSGLKSIVTDLFTPLEILSDKNKRNALFDLLKVNEAKFLCSTLGVSQALPYDELKASKFRKGSNNFQSLLKFFYIEELTYPEYSVSPKIDFSPQYPLFKHQRDAIRKANDYLNSHNNRCVLHMPTGAGKTRTAMNVVCNLLRSKESGLVLWLANSEELCIQAHEEFGKAWGYLGDREVNVFKFWGDNDLPNDTSLTNGVIIAGFAKLYASIKRNISNIAKINSSLDLMVVDEAHISIAETYQLVIVSMSLGRKKPPAILGLTATPGRTWNDPEKDKELSTFFHKQKVTLSISGYENPVDYLVDEGYLAKANYRKIEMSDSLDADDLKRLKGAFEIPDAILKKLANNELRNLKIVDELEKLSRVHKKIMFFATTVEHSNIIASLMSFRGLWAKSITAKTDSSLRAEYISEYKNSAESPMILCNFGVLTTGFDAPQTSCALIARPTTSLVLYSQMVGRAIRGVKAAGNKEAEIVTVVDNNLPGFRSVADSFVNWEDIWD